MAKLFVLTGPDVGLEIGVRDGLVIGRADECEARLRDASVSRKHARVERSGAGFEIVDLQSRNGLTKDGSRVERILLKNGEEFLLGNVRFRFTDASAAAVEEIELPLSDSNAAPASASTLTKAPTQQKTPSPKPGAEAGSARKRALATKAGVLQFEKIENQEASLLGDDVAQQSLPARILLILLIIAVAGGLFYGAMKLSGQLTPETPDEAAVEEPPK
ncbi:MAG: FHA domain-containing protein [Planctomycetota bacterium]